MASNAIRGSYQSVYRRLGQLDIQQVPASYVVRGNETIQKIAMKVFDCGYDSTVWRILARFNNITDLDSIQAGTVLVIPSDVLLTQ